MTCVFSLRFAFLEHLLPSSPPWTLSILLHLFLSTCPSMDIDEVRGTASTANHRAATSYQCSGARGQIVDGCSRNCIRERVTGFDVVAPPRATAYICRRICSYGHERAIILAKARFSQSAHLVELPDISTMTATHLYLSPMVCNMYMCHSTKYR